MSRLNIAPTKSNLLVLKRDLGVAVEGYSLLDQKREILVMELMVLLNRARGLEKRLQDAEAHAAETLKRALIGNGRAALRAAAAGVRYDHRVKAETRVVAGIRVPHIHVELAAFGPRYSLGSSTALMDEVIQAFLETLKLAGELAELENGVHLLAAELKKTQRRVNALEQIFIPDFRDTLKFVRDVLESKEIETIFSTKLVKRRLERAQEDGGS